MFWRFKSCGRCSGDLVLEDDLWRCMQCGHYYYPNVALPFDELTESQTASVRGPGRRKARTRCGGIAGRNINAMIIGNSVSNQRWWARNREIIAYLGEGRTATEIANLTAMGKRQVREVKEKLRDLLAQVEETDIDTARTG